MYSYELTLSLELNLGVKGKKLLSPTVASSMEVKNFWDGRVTLGNDFDGNPFNAYSEIASVKPDLKQMLIFAKEQHVQACEDAPSIHQAYDGYINNNMWSRLNPDDAYVFYVANALV